MEEKTNRIPRKRKGMEPEQLLKSYTNLNSVLSKLGFSELRDGQDKAVAAVFGGNDVIVILPTGKGKSAVYIIPTLTNDWRTIIFSPLVALMQDQTESLQKKGLRAAQLSSLQSDKENEMSLADWEQGNIDFLLAAPERLRNEKFLEAAQRVKPDMVTVDEVHTLSQWSDNFRSDYCKISDFIDQVNPRTVLCLTATCPTEVEEDVRRVINIPDAEKVVYLPPRKNLKYESYMWSSPWDLQKFINSINGSTIVYCATVKETHHLYETIGGQIQGGSLVFNGQMKQSEKASNQSLFMNSHVRVMFCTNSFGMGIDKENIRAVIHRDIPGSVENYSQETGRAGRDDKDSRCILFYDEKAIRTQEFFIQNGHPDKDTVVAFYNSVLSKSDKDRFCYASLYNICQDAGLNYYCAQPVTQILYGSKVLDRVKQDKVIKVKLKKDHIDSKYQKYYENIERFGIPDDEGYNEIDVELFVDAMGFAKNTVLKHLTNLAENDYIDYVPPAKGNPLKVIGGIKNVDFERLKEKEQEAHGKLNDIVKFFNTPDSEKQNFLVNYFTS